MWVASSGLCAGVQPIPCWRRITERTGEPSFASLGKVRKGILLDFELRHEMRPLSLFLTILIRQAIATDLYRPLSDGAHRHLVGPHGIDARVDCAMRNVTWAYAQSILPLRSPMIEARTLALTHARSHVRMTASTGVRCASA